MVIIEVEPRIVNAAGIIDSFGDETGTPQFYTIRDILMEHLGKNIYVSWNYGVFTFNIESDELDEGCDTSADSADFVKVIESICDFIPDDHYGGIYKGYQLQFEIVSVVEN